MLDKKFCINFIVFCAIHRFTNGEMSNPKNSLVFVIDDTGSMGDDIQQVRYAAKLIFHSVMSSNVSQIGNFVLVTFNDPDIRPAFITFNEGDFIAALDKIIPHGGGLCPEMAMKGLEEALIKSLPRSYIFVFTDASATDYREFPRIKSIAQKKSSQIVFVLTGRCIYNEEDPAYNVYEELATATSGQVFHDLEKGDVNKILNYVSEIVKSPRTVLAESEFTPGYDKLLNYTTDDKINDVIVAVSGKNPKIEVLKSNGTKALTTNIFETDNSLVVKVTDKDKGTHTAKLGSKSKTKAVITGSTLFNFKHGFSALKPTSIEDTVTRPIADKMLYLAIQLINPDNDVELQEVQLVDTSKNVLEMLPLDKIHEDFYVTKQLLPPNTLFKILIKGFDKNKKTPIERLSMTPIEPARLMDEGPPKMKAPTITSVGENLIKVNYDDSLQLRCKVNGFPKPQIKWIDEKSGLTISEMVEEVDLPYDYLSVLNIEHIKKNTSYHCLTFNDYGKDIRTVTVEATTKFVVVSASKDTSIFYSDEGSIYCIIDAIPPANVTWYLNGNPLEDDDDDVEKSSDGFVITIIRMQPRFEGQLICEAKNEFNRKLISLQLTMLGKALPKLRKTVKEVEVTKNQNIDLNCRVIAGIPQPNMVWFFKQQYTSDFIEISENSDVLHIKAADLDKAGTYRCEARNAYGKDSHDIDLVVEYPPAIKHDKTLIKTEDDKMVSLSCLVDGIPTPSVYWSFNGKIINNSHIHKIYRNKTLSFRSSIHNAGNYTCEANNKLGSERKTVQIIVYVPPQIKPPPETTLEEKVGSSLTLLCDATGHPKPTVKWLFLTYDTTKVLGPGDSSGSLPLPRLQASQSGFYICLAKNLGGSTNLTYTVQVLVPPTIERSSTKSATAVIGDLVLELPCRATGYPKPTITWMKNWLKIPTGTYWYDMKEDGTLIIKNVDNMTKGTYTCLAQNAVDTDINFINVNVLDFPLQGRLEKIVDLEIGQSATINCDIPHKKTDILRWYKDSKYIADGELILYNVQPSDQGLYTCRVNTFSGSTSATISVKVGFKPMFTTDEDENVDFKLDADAYLSCVARGEPKPKVKWLFNGKTLNVSSWVYTFRMSEKNIGQYICVVSNKYGTKTRNFNIINRDCLFDTLNTDIDSPKIEYVDLRSYTYSNIIQVPRGETLTLTCPGEFVHLPGNNIEAICIQDTTVEINKRSIKISEIKCNTDNIRPVTRRLRYSCAPGPTEKVKVGYESNGVFVDTYEICYDTSKTMPIYSTHRTNPHPTGKESRYETKWFETDLVPYNYDDLYNCERQIEKLSVPFSNGKKCCFAKRQLVNALDVSPGLPQMVTYSNLNVVPHWSTCGSENWDEVEKRIRSISTHIGRELIVHTGIAFRSRPNMTKFLIDKNHKRQPIPTFLWKVVQDKWSTSSLAIIHVNIPYLNASEASTYILCSDICSYVNWMDNRKWRDVSRGFTYCCSVTEFEKALGFLNVFSPGMDNIPFVLSSVAENSLA